MIILINVLYSIVYPIRRGLAGSGEGSKQILTVFAKDCYCFVYNREATSSTQWIKIGHCLS